MSPFTIHQVETCGSTNDEIKELSKQNPSKPILLIADEQTKGKGQRENTWVSLKNSGWYFSIYFPHISIPLKEVQRINWIVSIQLVKYFIDLGISTAQIKWPNDLFTSNGKLGGILIENQINHATLKSTIIGIGINCKPVHVENTWKGTTNLESELNHTRVELDNKLDHINFICKAIHEEINKPLVNLETLRSQVIKYSFGINRFYTLEWNGELIVAKIIGIDNEGMLILQNGAQLVKASSGSLKWINEI